MKIKTLRWRKPNGTGSDLGHEDSLWVADGVGGKYSITGDSGAFLLWWPHDEFTFEEHATVANAKVSAEAHWQDAVGRLLQSETV